MAFGSTLTFNIGWVEIGLTLSLLFLYFYYTWTYAYAYWKRRNVPYLKPTFPFGNVSDVLLLKKNFVDTWTGFYNDMGNHPFCGIYSVKQPILIVKDLGLIKHILTKDFSHFSDHGWFTNSDHEPLLNNLFHMRGEEWKKMRTKLGPAFSSGKMKMMFAIMNGCAQELKQSIENTCKGSGTFEAKELMSRFAVDVIVNCVFGFNATSLKNPGCKFYKTGKQIFDRSLKRMFSNIILAQSPSVYSLLKLHFLDYDGCQYFADLIKHTIDDRVNDNIAKNDFLHILVRLKNNLSIDDADMFPYSKSNSDRRLTEGDAENQKSTDAFTLDDVLAQALAFFFAGFETTASALSFCLYELSTLPDIQLKIQIEVDAALKRHGSFTYEMLQELPYIDNVLNETLRMYGALASLDRVCVKPYKIPDTDILIEEGCKVTIPSYAIHHDPQYYPDPYKFDPDRFLEENVKSRPGYTYMPFGEGPRQCIGMRFARMEMRLVLATFFSNFSCKLNPHTRVPLSIACGEVLITTSTDVLIDVIPRDTLQHRFTPAAVGTVDLS